MGIHYSFCLVRMMRAGDPVRLRDYFPEVHPIEGSGFAVADLRSPGEAQGTSEYGTRALSQEFHEAAFFFASGSGSCFQYEHSARGMIIRALAFTECTWERLEGAPEPWESAFYPPHMIEMLVADLAAAVPDPHERKRVEAELRKTWATHSLVSDALSFPVAIDAVAGAVHTYFGIPGPAAIFALE